MSERCESGIDVIGSSHVLNTSGNNGTSVDSGTLCGNAKPSVKGPDIKPLVGREEDSNVSCTDFLKSSGFDELYSNSFTNMDSPESVPEKTAGVSHENGDAEYYPMSFFMNEARRTGDNKTVSKLTHSSDTEGEKQVCQDVHSHNKTTEDETLPAEFDYRDMEQNYRHIDNARDLSFATTKSESYDLQATKDYQKRGVVSTNMSTNEEQDIDESECGSDIDLKREVLYSVVKVKQDRQEIGTDEETKAAFPCLGGSYEDLEFRKEMTQNTEQRREEDILSSVASEGLIGSLGFALAQRSEGIEIGKSLTLVTKAPENAYLNSQEPTEERRTSSVAWVKHETGENRDDSTGKLPHSVMSVSVQSPEKDRQVFPKRYPRPSMSDDIKDTSQINIDSSDEKPGSRGHSLDNGLVRDIYSVLNEERQTVQVGPGKCSPHEGSGDSLDNQSLINSSETPVVVFPTPGEPTGLEKQSSDIQLGYIGAENKDYSAGDSSTTNMADTKSFPDSNNQGTTIKRPRPSIPGDNSESADNGNIGVCGYILWACSLFLIVITFPVALCMCIKVVQEYERAVIFRLGRLVSGGAKGPGLFFIVPCVDSYSKVDLRTVSFDVPPQEVLTKDSVTVAVDAVVYYRVSNATISVTNVEDANRSTRLLAQTTLRNVLGTKNLSEILSDREQISNTMQDSLDIATDPWGIKVERVEVKDVRLPVQLQRAMAAEAEAARDARAKVIAAEGEQKASRALKEAADVISESPAALQLRYLQTLNAISAEKNSTIIFPLPIDMMQAFIRK